MRQAPLDKYGDGTNDPKWVEGNCLHNLDVRSPKSGFVLKQWLASNLKNGTHMAISEIREWIPVDRF